ncbi:secreted lipase [Penicillium macrosclerotiorum]|uniref:secreted lipase n=1 Tax=Penicillium macrosclerotiorum TaxID=303699 RepID=UPI0025472065|nr:secreted lipase [Penicillium macrosclerotiorum]KAJ5689838.1 secreted lipase [Penicillium macrosclerotiorum]
MLLFLHFVILALTPAVWGVPAKYKRASAPTVTINQPQATIVGSAGSNSVDSFNGIPFAQAPTGSLRLKPPQAIQTSLGTVKATGTAKSCPQFYFTTDTSDFPISILGELANIPLFQTVSNAGEDCLSVSIRRPSGTEAGADLPVLVWIFGGGFELGSTAMYDGSSLVSASMDLDMPIVFVAINYRVGGFGFMPGAEILQDGSANLGLLDQRLALEWVADNIKAFGGDPSKVTIWGESAGSISVFDQMALYDGDHTYNGSPLFRAGIMNSGSIVPADPVDGTKGQAVYDKVVEEAGCATATDTLECLRGVDYTTFLNAANSVPGILSYNSVALSYLPRPDGTVLTDSPENLVKSGKYASVPFIVGDQEDEGTIFALFQSNISTTAQIVTYLQELFFFDASKEQLKELVATYPDTTTDGSPFRTSIFNNWYSQYKRIAAILGDLTFTITRRAFLSLATQAKPDVPSWSYLSSYDYGTPILGTFHGSDILQVFYGILPNYASKSIHSYYLSFVYNMDPNTQSADYMDWPQWGTNQSLMNFFNDHATLLADTFRQDTYDFLLENIASFHI